MSGEKKTKPLMCHVTNAAGEVVHSTDGGFIAPLLAGLAGMFLPKLLGLGSGESVPYNIHIGHHGKHGIHLGEGHPIPSGHKLNVPAMKKYVHQHLMKGDGVFGSGVKYHRAAHNPTHHHVKHTGAGVFGSNQHHPTSSINKMNHQHEVATHTTHTTHTIPHAGKHLTLNKHHQSSLNHQAKGSSALVPHDNNQNSVISDEISNKKKLLAQIYICL